ncbi:MAG TPA: family 16 glycosylhydrolase [Polyangiaceae bacterium]|nr:family 16 glycosylhydrolase [Polyangiaceae bacterium]
MRLPRLALIFAPLAIFSCSTREPAHGNSPAGGGGSGATSGGSSDAGANPVAGASSGGSSSGTGADGSLPGQAAGGSTAVAGSAGSGGAGGAPVKGPPFGHPDPSVVAPQYDGFTLWLVEDFTQPLDLATDPIWTYSDGGFETHRFTKDAITFEDGKMVLTLSDTTVPASCAYANTGLVMERKRKAGELRTKHNWFRYGRYEARLKAPSVKPNDPVTNGNYIASLFTYRQPACQEWREIDLEVTGDTATRLSTNLITAEKDCNFSADKEQPQVFELPGNFRTDFQTIGFEWLPGSIKFYYLDAQGKVVQLRELTGAKVPTLSAKILANLWMFNDTFDFGGPMGANNLLPFRAEYDFVRFYRWDQDLDYPCADMTASCLKPEDVDLTRNNACDGIATTGDLAACKQCGTTVRMACTDTCQ